VQWLYRSRRVLEVKYPCTDAPMHGLINNIDTKAKCRLKKLICKGTLQQVFIRVYRLEIHQLCCYSRLSFVNSCPLPFSLVQLPPPPCVNKYSVYRYTVCREEGMGNGVLDLRQIKTCSKVPLQVNFLDCIAFYESYLSTLLWLKAGNHRIDTNHLGLGQEELKGGDNSRTKVVIKMFLKRGRCCGTGLGLVGSTL
jgi:hypothetical protein